MWAVFTIVGVLSSTVSVAQAGTDATWTYLVAGSGYEEALVLDVATAATHTVTLEHKVPGDSVNDLLTVGPFLVYPGDRATYAAPLFATDRPRRLGRATFNLASASPGRVWLVATTRNDRRVPVTAQQVAVDGTRRGKRHRLPLGTTPVADTSAGLLLSDGGAAVVWDPVTRGFGSRLPSGSLVDAQGPTIVWGLDCSAASYCRSLRVLGVTSGQTRDVAAPPGSAGWVSTWGQGSRDAISEVGGLAAVRAASAPGTPPPSELYIIDLSTGAVTLVPGMAANAYARVAWLPDAPVVATQRDDGAIVTYDVASHERRTYPARCCAVALLAISG